MATLSARLSVASHFLLQSPPGEVNDCFNDIRSLIADDEALEIGIVPALRMYNEEQLVTVDLEGKQVLIAKGAKVFQEKDDDRYFDPRLGVSFTVNHVTATASDSLPYKTDAETQAIRDEFDTVLKPYVDNHYNDGSSGVYALPDEDYLLTFDKEEEEEIIEEKELPAEETVEEPLEPEVVVPAEEVSEGGEVEVDEIKIGDEESPKEDIEEEVEEEKEEEEERIVEDSPAPPTAEEVVEEETITVVIEDEPAPPPSKPKLPSYPIVKSEKFEIYIVGNKYNPSNYWTGRWRSTYLVDLTNSLLTSTININIHYYELGNVQLTTKITSSTPLSSSSPSGKEIVALIKTIENGAQLKLSAASNDLSEGSFRGLRRALPKTRTKLDWGRIAAYRLGTELGSSTVGITA